MYHRTYDGHLLLPSSGQIRYQFVKIGFETEYGDQFLHHDGVLLLGHLVKDRVVDDVLTGGDIPVQTVVLLRYAYYIARDTLVLGDLVAVYDYGACGVVEQGGQHPYGGGLTGTVGSQESIYLPCTDLQVHTLYRLEISESLG